MEIKIDNYVIRNAGSHNIDVDEVTLSKNFTVTTTNRGHFATWRAALTRVLELKLSESAANDVVSVLAAIEQAKSEIIAAIPS